MRQHEITFETLANEVAQQKEERKLKRAGETVRRIRKQSPVRSRQQILDFLLSMTDRASGCWNWIGSRDRCGYGKMTFGKETLAHRISWVAHGNSIPAMHYICHRCDNPSCINPDHMFVGMQVDNVRDMFSKGRNNGPKGERVNTAVLSPEDIRAIREVYSAKMGRERVRRGTLKALSKQYKVHVSTIINVVRGKTWKTACPL